MVVYKFLERPAIDKIKEDISNILKSYFIDVAQIVFMPHEDFERRYRLADKFVLSLITNCVDK